MNALILRGDRAGDRQLVAVHNALAAELEAQGYHTRSILLRDTRIAYCRGCFQCWVKTPGVCRTHDRAADVASSFVHSDVVVLLTQITFGGYSSEMKKALDRMIGIVSPFFTRVHGEVHHEKRYGSYPRIIAIGTLPTHCVEEEATFHALVARNAINMHAPAHTSHVLCYDDATFDAQQVAVDALHAVAPMQVAV